MNDNDPINEVERLLRKSALRAVSPEAKARILAAAHSAMSDNKPALLPAKPLWPIPLALAASLVFAAVGIAVNNALTSVPADTVPSPITTLFYDPADMPPGIFAGNGKAGMSAPRDVADGINRLTEMLRSELDG